MVDAVRTAGDVHPAVKVDGDPAGREPAVRAIAAEPWLRLVPVDVAAKDLPAGDLADVEGAAPLVQADPFELRPAARIHVEVDGGPTAVTIMRVRGRRDCDGCDHGQRDGSATAQWPRPTLGSHRLSFGSISPGTIPWRPGAPCSARRRAGPVSFLCSRCGSADRMVVLAQ